MATCSLSSSHPLVKLMARIGKTRITQTIYPNEYQQSIEYKYPNVRDVVKLYAKDMVRVAANMKSNKRHDSIRPPPFPLPIPIPPKPIPPPIPTPVPVPIPVSSQKCPDIFALLGIDIEAFVQHVQTSKTKACAGENRNMLIYHARKGLMIEDITNNTIKAMATYTKQNIVYVDRSGQNINCINSKPMHAIVNKKSGSPTSLVIWEGARLVVEEMRLDKVLQRVVVEWGYKNDVSLLKITPSKVLKIMGDL